MKYIMVCSAVAVLMLCGTGAAEAAGLNPADYAALGDLTDPSGTPFYQINASGPVPTITDVLGNTIFTGVLDPSGTIAVFTFHSININSLFLSDAVGPGQLPVALLSQGSINIGSGSGIAMDAVSSIDGAGASNLAVGQGGSTLLNPGASVPPFAYTGGSGGGGFGGAGETGGNGAFASIPFPVLPAGGVGGGAYGDLSVSLQGGSRGGSGTGTPGGGGGAIELGAIGAIVIAGNITANGGAAMGIPFSSGGDGGGSGGGIFIHGSSVTLDSSAILDANGGAGDGYGFSIAAGGGGGGGRVLIDAPGGFSGSLDSISVVGAGNGQTGQALIIGAVPEPASVAMLGTGLIGVIALTLRSRKRRTAA